MIAFRMVTWQCDVFVHVESDYIFEREFTSLEKFDEMFVGRDR